ncbi:ATPase family associated with various cellular activities (AAA) [Lignipirellula cremea]|uniref:ATPase family associated with various cellular activities (AAA) n=2 Tax=Lignipirellula cremea TaxID=2528010 RepID=A0A518DX69_9BACT|nr:ATPase family associated with various cellular activities (AAA) [Lignipirellula cremea]
MAPKTDAGRPAKCPQCNALTPIPRPADAGTSPVPPSDDTGSSREEGLPLVTATPASSPPASSPPAGESVFGGTAEESELAPFAAASPASRDDRPIREERADTPTKRLFDRICAEIGKIYVGQDELVLGALAGLFSRGHVLIESVPGLGKTLLVRALGRVLGCDFGRIQFTADLMPSDITGAPMFDMKTQEFRFRPGPVFTQLLLADEINRAPAKTHAALLETMQEYRVTVDGVSHDLGQPFFVLATQNPIESEGTYNLPEAQLDRFMFKLIASYPAENEEAHILELHSRQIPVETQLEKLECVTSPEEINRITLENSQVRIDARLIGYINKLVRATRQWPQFHMGASPRAGIALMQSARTLAAFYGRDYAVPDDVRDLALPALRHRVVLSAEAEVEGHDVDELLTELLRSVEVPRL